MSPESRPERLLLISDLHLEEDRPELTRAFLEFLACEGPKTQQLGILGDLFNFWLGDDDERPLNLEISAALRNQADAGLDIFLLHGNRDFLLGENFAHRAGAVLVKQDCLGISWHEHNCIALHGDTLCTLDTEYQQFRNMVRDPAWQADFLARPLPERRAFAEQARAQSRSMSSNKAADIMDVSQEAVEAMMQKLQVRVLIHGHTHRPAEHEFTLAGQPAKRFVLGDWGKTGWFLELTPRAISLRSFAI